MGKFGREELFMRMGNLKRGKIGKVAVSLVVILAALVLLLPVEQSFASDRQWENDPVTDERYEETFNKSTLNTGKVLTDKSVDDGFTYDIPGGYKCRG